MIPYLRVAVIVLFVCSLLMPAPRLSAAQEATPQAACVTTTPEENTALVKAFWDEVIWGKQGKIAEIVAPDEVHHWGIDIETAGLDAFSQTFDLFLAAFPDIEFTVDLVAADGDRVASAWTAHGTQSGEWQGIAPTNKEVTWSGIDIFRIACGKIAEAWGEANNLGLLAQLGAAGVPAFLADVPVAGTPMAAAAATPCAEDTAEANLALVRRWTDEVWTGQKLDVLDEIASPEIVHHAGAFPDAHGVEAVKEGVDSQLAIFPDMSLTVDEAFADGDLAVVRWSGTGTNEGEFLGHAPTGRETTIAGINIYRVNCGKIVESWSEINGLAMLRQVQEAAGTPTP